MAAVVALAVAAYHAYPPGEVGDEVHIADRKIEHLRGLALAD